MSIIKRAKIDVLKAHLTGALAEGQEDRIGIFVFKDESDFQENLEQISQFFRKGQPNTNGWEEKIDDLLDIELRTIKRVITELAQFTFSSRVEVIVDSIFSLRMITRFLVSSHL